MSLIDEVRVLLSQRKKANFGGLVCWEPPRFYLRNIQYFSKLPISDGFALDLFQHSQIHLFVIVPNWNSFKHEHCLCFFWICKIVFGFSLETKAGVWGEKKKKKEHDIKEELLYEEICFLPDSCGAPQAAQIGQVVKSRPAPSAFGSFLCLNLSVWGMNCNLFSLTHSFGCRV